MSHRRGLSSKTIIGVADMLRGPWDVFTQELCYVSQRHSCGAGDHGGGAGMWAGPLRCAISGDVPRGNMAAVVCREPRLGLLVLSPSVDVSSEASVRERLCGAGYITHS